jgi:glutamate formiminotransferase/formiminotetrahydrofolate cyclodeaminase
MKIVECVPNFSEGRDLAVIKQITDEIEETEGAVLLDVDPGAMTNRTVVTLVGEPDAVVEAAFRAIKRAAEVIDMSNHEGAHPRMGATDVCPFVPVSGLTMDDCVELANRLGKRVGEELGIPVYLYEYAAKTPERQNLATIRSGEYEGLKAKLNKPEWKPDYGPAKFNAKAGATVIGAREFLIAYNINLNTRDKKQAHEIALTIREKGRWARDEDGKIVRDDDNNKVRQEGMFNNCKAIGWYIEEYNRAQISINFTNYKKTTVHEVFEAVRELAAENGLRVTGSELVGLTPMAMLYEAGRYYLEKQGKSTGVPVREILEIGVMSLGLNDIAPFDIDEKVIEYRVDKIGELASKNIQEFADEVSVDSPVPGGGSVAALCGSMGAALAAMVANLTHNKKGYEESWDECVDIAEKGQKLKDIFVKGIDRDSQSFDNVLAAMRLPKKTDEDKEARDAAIQEASKGAVSVPMETLRATIETLDIAKRIAEIGNVNSVSDAGVAAQCARAAAIGAAYNVLINLDGIEDEEFVKNSRAEANSLREKAEKKSDEVDKIVLGKL